MNNISAKNKYRYIIIDDDDVDRLTLSHYLKNYIYLEHLASFSNPQMGLDFIKENDIDILFLDIEMEGMSGIDLLRKVRKKVPCTVFITSHMEYAVDGFQLEALDYIVKPYREDRIARSIKKIDSFMDMQLKASLFDHTINEETIQVKWSKETLLLKVYEIIYLEALKDYTRIVSINSEKKILTIHSNLGQLLANEDKLKGIIRVHKSFAVNKSYIRSVSQNSLVLINDLKIPVGPAFKHNLDNILS